MLDLLGHLDLAPAGCAIFFSSTSAVWPARVPGGDFPLAFRGLVFPGPVFTGGSGGWTTVTPLAGRRIAVQEPCFKIVWKSLICRQFLVFVPGLVGPDTITPTNNQVIAGVAVGELVPDALRGLTAGQEREQQYAQQAVPDGSSICPFDSSRISDRIGAV